MSELFFGVFWLACIAFLIFGIYGIGHSYLRDLRHEMETCVGPTGRRNVGLVR